MQYDLTRLGDQQFEDLTQALALCILGPGVQVFGSGPDGGREASFNGRVSYPVPSQEGNWDGYGVLQAKYKLRPTTTTADTAWFKRQVKKELDRWADPKSNRVIRGRLPEYLLFATNVVLSGSPGGGGIDALEEVIAGYRDRLPLKGWDVWHNEQICRYLDVYSAVRRTYAAFTTPGDILAQLAERIIDSSADELSLLMTSHAAKELVAQQWIRLGEAGHPTNQKLSLSAVAVDLPAIPNRVQLLDPAFVEVAQPSISWIKKIQDSAAVVISHSTGAGKTFAITEMFKALTIKGVAAYILGRGDGMRRPSRPRPVDDPHVVLIGGPGQGKSTIGQLLCQIYRAALLEQRPPHTLGPEATSVLARLRADHQLVGLPTPACLRWPVQISLSRYGDALAGGEDLSLLRYLAQTMSQRTEISTAQLKSWLRIWPWLLVLDGLDEVAAPSVRERVMDSISDFLIDAAEVDADLLIVATTRPQGYGDEFRPNVYEHLQLRPLNVEEALGYAQRLADVRHHEDPDLRDTVLSRLVDAAKEPVTARLMGTPLQVTIMSLLLERRTRAPQDRYGLFEAYYNTLYEREVAKETPVSALLDEQRGNINYLHERVGLLLQVRAEHAGDAEAAMPVEELRDLTAARLISEGYAAAGAGTLADRLVTAATDRLVLLVPRAGPTIGFEIRSLQELMAARALFADGDAAIIERLRELAPSAHWRNTWLFAASRLFAQREHLRDAVIRLLEEIDTANVLQMFLTPGARLAVDMLNEDVAAKAPMYQRLLVHRALGLLDYFPDDDIKVAAEAVYTAVEVDRTTRDLAHRTVTKALSGGGRSALTARFLLACWADHHVGAAATTARQRLSEMQRQRPDDLDQPTRLLVALHPTKIWASLSHAHRGLKDTDSPSNLLTELSKALSHETPKQDRTRLLEAVRHLQGNQLDETSKLLRPDLLETLVTAAENVPLDRWPAAARLRRLLAVWHQRQPVADPAPPASAQGDHLL